MANLMVSSSPPENQITEMKTVTYNDIASKLLKDKFILTALELHTELVECGKELKQLKDFFSNPGNFEYATPEITSRISRSESQATLDSLDLTRYSEDGTGGDERVAVLEFELRKAKETINALRNNLTMATESESNVTDKDSVRQLSACTIKPHEQRALNFLINEYLLLHSYKLTSITFADENQRQDFDDWDDVGLNIAKPPELLTIYRNFLKQTGQDSIPASTQTDFDFSYEDLKDASQAKDEELKMLEAKYKNLEADYFHIKNINMNHFKEPEMCYEDAEAQEDLHKTTPNSKDSLGSESPSERFEIIDKNMQMFKKRDSIATLEDNISNNSFNVNDWTNLAMPNHDSTHKEKSLQIGDTDTAKLFNINVSDEIFKKEVFSLCYVNIPQKVDNAILDDILNYSVTNENLVHTLSQSLLKIIPNIILNKREDAIPLLISAVHLNPNSKERDKLLQQLFNLKKKPSDTERIMILTGLVGIARFSGENLVENEILPQCWEQLTDKHVERRLLVAEACTALIPYVSSQIRNSLILSMLQQLLDDREAVVRESVIRALSLVIALCEDTNKYSQCEDLAFGILDDPSPGIAHLATQILFPVIGKWALSIDRLTSHLIKHVLQSLNDRLKEDASKSSGKVLRIIRVLENLIPFLLMSAAAHESVLRRIEEDMAAEMRADVAAICSNLTNPCKFYKSDYNVGMILYEFDKSVAENADASWPQMNWILEMMIPDLLNSLNHFDVARQELIEAFINLFSCICVLFGHSFTKRKIQQIFHVQISNLEQILSNFSQYSPSLNIIPVYLVSVLSYCDREELSRMLMKFLSILPLCGTPLDYLEISVKELCERKLQSVVVASLWEGVVHQRPLVRSAAAHLFSIIVKSCDKDLLNLKVTPAIVTLANDIDVTMNIKNREAQENLHVKRFQSLVKTAAIPALGSLITDCTVKEIQDKAYMQLHNYLSDMTLRQNHTFLRQLIVTLGFIVNWCSVQFRQEVILPQLSHISVDMSQMSNQTRKIDLANALIEAFAAVVFGLSEKREVVPLIMPGLKCLESAVCESQALVCHRDTVCSMIKECEELNESSASQSPLDHSIKLGQNVNQGVEEVKQRVSKIFTKPTSSKPNALPNLHSIFKKKM